MLLSTVLGDLGLPPPPELPTKLCGPPSRASLSRGPEAAQTFLCTGAPPCRARRLRGAAPSPREGLAKAPEFPPLAEKSLFPSLPTNRAPGQKPAHHASLGFWGAASPLLLVGKKGPETLLFPPGAEPSRAPVPAFLPTALGAWVVTQEERSFEQKGAPVWVGGWSPSQSYQGFQLLGFRSCEITPKIWGMDLGLPAIYFIR